MSSFTNMLSRAEAYLTERRALGFTLGTSGNLTLAFARFADASGHEGPLNPEIVLRWAKDEALYSDPFSWAGRVKVLRPFACWLAEIEPETAFPHGQPFGRSQRRVAPHIYTPAEIATLLEVAQAIPREFGAGAETMPTLLGLLAATGLRVSEALGLLFSDWDQLGGLLTVRHSKFERSRIVPLHNTASEALKRYAAKQVQVRQRSPSSSLFTDECDGSPLRYKRVRQAWLYILSRAGISPRGGHTFVRIHDLRHTFICQRLMIWQAQGAEIDNAMVALSTYVGHAQPSDTYWYLQCVPELMAIAGSKFEGLNNEREEKPHA